jgi:hypothetical protein
VVFTLVVRKVLLTRVPLDTVSILCYFVTQPKIPHFYRLQTLPFDGVTSYTNGGGIVAMDLCFWLRVAQLWLITGVPSMTNICVAPESAIALPV